jgi:hypothetical protein
MVPPEGTAVKPEALRKATVDLDWAIGNLSGMYKRYRESPLHGQLADAALRGLKALGSEYTEVP